MELISQLLLNTLQIGVVYVLFSLGLTIIFGVMKIVNFAHGELFTLSALLVTVFVNTTAAQAGLPVWVGYVLGFAAGVAAVLVLGYAIYQIGFKHFLRDLVGSFILSVGILLVLQGIYLEVFGGFPRMLPALMEGTVTILGGHIRLQRLIISAIAVGIIVAAYLLIQRTRLGKALRAVAEDQEAAMLQGIRYRRISLYGFLIGAVLAAVAGALMAPLTVVSPAIGSDYLIRSFIIVIVGGLGSISGAIIAGFLIAFIESIGSYYFDPSLTAVALLILVMTVLIIRPEGIMGRAQR